MRSVKYDFWAHALNKLVYVLPDEWYLFLRFKDRVGYWPHLRHPRSFNEKLQWLKLHDKHAEYTQMVDKVEAKKIRSFYLRRGVYYSNIGRLEYCG